MKKILTIAVLILVAASCSLAQDASSSSSSGQNDLKNFRFGLYATPSLEWYKPDNVKHYSSGGAVFKFGYGLATEFRLNSIASFATGIDINYDGGKLNFQDSAYYFISQDAITSVKDTAGKKVDQYRLVSRTYKVNYVTIPLTLKMKTKEIGYITYYGQFGVNMSIKTKAKADDDLLSSTLSSSNQTNLDIGSDMNLFKFALNVGAGIEYNVSGSTSFVVGINYLNGFSNVLKSPSKYLQQGIFNQTPITQKATNNGVALTVGVLF